MPQAIDLVIKNSSAVDKTFKLIAPAAGYGSVAEWALKEGLISSVFPRLTAMVRNGGTTPGRAPSKVTQLKARVPSSYTDSVTGLTNVMSAFEFNGSFSVPADFPESLKDDAIAYTSNFIATALVKAMVKDGSSAS